jgi:alkylation response protein AidB-like acyl-CoA dehydrogenase
MEFGWTTEQQLLRETLGKVGRRIAASREEAVAAPEGEGWRRCAEAGVFSLGRSGREGRPADLVTAAAGLEALARALPDNGLLFCVVGQICSSVYPVSSFGSAAQRGSYLEALCQGTLVGASAASEADAGSDLSAMATRYQRVDGGYVLEGSKVFVTSAPLAGLFLVLARDGQRAAEAPPRLSYFLVPQDTPGLGVGSPYNKMGLDSAPLGELILDECRLPGEALLGTEGAGGMMLQALLEWERIALAACHVGTMDRVLEETVRHTRRRRQFGKPLLQHQQVGARLADVRAELEASRLLVYHAAWCKRGGRSAPLEAALAKLFTSEAYVRSSMGALQLRGAYGYMVEEGVEGQVRDALASTIYAGTSEVLRNLVAALL